MFFKNKVYYSAIRNSGLSSNPRFYRGILRELIYMKTIFAVTIISSLLLFCQAATSRGEDKTDPPRKTPEIGTLIKALNGEAQGPRLRAKAALIGMGEKVGPALLKSLSTADPGAVFGLIEILGMIRYRESAPEIEKIWQGTKDPKIKLVAAQALCRFDHNYARYQGYILSQTNTGDEDHQLEAMQMLGYIGDKRVIAPLVKIFNDKERSDQVRQAAIWDLAHTPDRESAEALVTLVNDPGVDWFYKEIIIAALRKLATQKDMAPIVSELLLEAQALPVSSEKRKK